MPYHGPLELRRALQYVPELTWILFLRLLDAQETRDLEEAEALGRKDFAPALREPTAGRTGRRHITTSPATPTTPEGKPVGWKRQELYAAGEGKLFDFINKELLPSLHGLDIDSRTGLPNPAATRKQRIIGRIMTAVQVVRVDSETNLRDILDRVDEISVDNFDDTHFSIPGTAKSICIPCDWSHGPSTEPAPNRST